MKHITRRSFVASCVAVPTGVRAFPAEAASGSIAMEIFRAGFIVGVSGGKGALTFKHRSYPLAIGGVSAGATIGAASVQLIGSVSHIKDAPRHRGCLFCGGRRSICRRGQVGRAAFQRARRFAATEGSSSRLHVLDRFGGNANLTEVALLKAAAVKKAS